MFHLRSSARDWGSLGPEPSPDQALTSYQQQTSKTKDHIEKMDFQELIFAVVNWPNSELYGAFVCIICYIG